ncbi:hypothetical protein LTR10_021073 [Elasticomyces elasticus]|uniref:Clr5 domain-containing protein n=1 Tax=Exophiala sideris TaxID=1016849 RepID=A0ABR0J9C7_9EURO|nr:hypothetical protein LTR10_021073 [Elasticomyces elasticus]KAK5027793.1 hypothetical protein LTS07_006668 [Exophiala sideris]KAK5037619.1 hypothetical protein LTR13_004778 [Exophiala sideris]KAK5059281.1 hypothetical protein LTR69_006571 [Exophiala sideris]KAK5183115.1 hypothetical protein LTR44_004826 [Eurotiomycetes sp. CCFEE 6388]
MAMSLGDHQARTVIQNNVAQAAGLATPTSGAPTHLEAREGPAPAQWQAVKDEIRILYERKPLRDVKKILEQRHGFRATERMYKARLAQWGFSKNYSDKDYQICAVLHHARQKSGKHRTAFIIHGHKRSAKDLHKYIKGRKMSEDAFLATALKNIRLDNEQERDQLAHVRAYTPPPAGPNTPQNERDGDDYLYSPMTVQSTSTAKQSPTETVMSGSGSFSAYRNSPTFSRPASQGKTRSTALYPAPLSATDLTLSRQQIYVSQYASSDNTPDPSTVTWQSQLQQSSFSRLGPSPLDQHLPAASNIPMASSYDSLTIQGSLNGSPTMGCPSLGRDVEYMALQVVDAPSLRSLCGHDDLHAWRLLSSDTSSLSSASSLSASDGFEHVCPTCHDLTRNHFISLPNLENTNSPAARSRRSILNETSDVTEMTMSVPTSSRGHQHSWKWVARCFAACIYLSRGNETLSHRSLADAEGEFERMLVPTQDPKILLALNQTLQILHMHDQGEITKTIMRAAHDVAVRVLGPDDPLTTITRWMVYVADLNMRDRDITSATLHNVHARFVERYGSEDPRAIASLYCFGYMLNVERRLEQAEGVLREVYAVSCANLGPKHLQSLSALTNLARCLERQDRLDEAIENLQTVVKDSRDTLGDNHPRRLETMRVLGTFYEKQGCVDVAEKLYWKVLEGRIKMLGVNHGFTRGMQRDLEELLRSRGKWEVGDGSGGQSEAQLRMQDLFEWNPDEWEDMGGASDGNSSDGVGSEHDAF